MRRKILLVPIILLLLAPLIIAQDNTPNIFLTLVDINNKKPITNMSVEVGINDQKENYFIEEDTPLKLRLSEGKYGFSFLVNYPKTEGPDYYGEIKLLVGKNTIQTIHLYPVGSMLGFVKDKKDNVISSASLKFDCNQPYTLKYPSHTDKFGSFSLKAVPVGKCKIYGSYKNGLGTTEIEIKKGKKILVDIKLDQIVVSENNYVIYIGAIIIILLIGTLLVIFWMRKTI